MQMIITGSRNMVFDSGQRNEAGSKHRPGSSSRPYRRPVSKSCDAIVKSAIVVLWNSGDACGRSGCDMNFCKSKSVFKNRQRFLI